MITLTFTKNLQKLVTDGIQQVFISGALVSPLHWGKRDARVLSFFLKEEVIHPEMLSEAVHNLLKKTGRNCYIQHTKEGIYPDHTQSPEAFAYALKHGEFLPKEERRICFDHGETKTSFIEIYCGNIQESVVQQLLQG